MVRRSSLALAVLLALSCTHQLPTWEGTEPDATANDPALAKADPAPAAGEPEAEAAGEGGVAQSGAPDEAAPEEGGETEASPPAKEPLPKPLHAKVDGSCGKAPGVGQRVKSFKLPTPAGKTISPASYRGRVMLLNFWGTWCEPCLKELPEFDRLYRRYRKHGLTVVAVATDEDGQAVQAFASERKLSTRMAYKGEATAGQYGARTFPFTFVVDHAGVIRAAYDGYKPGCMGKLEADIRKQLEALPD